MTWATCMGHLAIGDLVPRSAGDTGGLYSTLSLGSTHRRWTLPAACVMSSGAVPAGSACLGWSMLYTASTPRDADSQVGALATPSEVKRIKDIALYVLDDLLHVHALFRPCDSERGCSLWQPCTPICQGQQQLLPGCPECSEHCHARCMMVHCKCESGCAEPRLCRARSTAGLLNPPNTLSLLPGEAVIQVLPAWRWELARFGV